MAYIKERPRAFLVCWRDAETGKTKSRSFSWGNPYREGTIGREEFSGPLTREEARAAAEDARLQAEQHERRSTRALHRIQEKYPELKPEPIFADWDEPGSMFEVYLRRIIDQDTELRQASRETYLAGLKKHIEGTALGRSAIHMITPDMVREFWAGLSKQGIGVGARRNVYLLLSKAFSRAVNDEIIDASPIKRSGIKQPAKGRREEIIPLTVDELERLADHAQQPRDRLAVLLMGYGGLRAGELGGLRVQDVDFEKCKLSIRQQVVQTHREKKVASLKTRSARRTIEVACSVTDELRAYVEANPPCSDGRIFCGNDGDLWAHTKINRQVQKAAAAAGLRHIHSHMLRHTAVSLLIDDGANPKAIQAFVGHARIQETLDTYGHPFDSGGAALAQSMEKRRAKYRKANGKR
jgi:integrase